MLRPLGDRILVQRSEAEDVTKGGIILPDAAKKKPRQGTVIAVGPGKRMENGSRAPMEVAVGDVIVYTEWSGTEVKLKSGEEYLILEADSVLAVK